MKKLFVENKKYIKLFVVISILYCLCITGIIRANALYKSDVFSVYYGDLNWSSTHQYFIGLICKLFNFQEYVFDITPLSQLLAMVLLSLSSTILIKLFKNNHKINILNILAVIPFAISPYILGIISYRIGSLYISFSIFMCLLPYLFINKKRNFALASIVCIFIVFTSYAQASSIYLIVGIFLFLKKYCIDGLELKNALKLLLYRFLYFIIALSMFILLILVLDKSWHLELHKFIYAFYNFKNIFINLFQNYDTIWLILIFIIVFIFILSNILTCNHDKLLTFMVVLCCLFLSIILIPGIYIFFNNAAHINQYIFITGLLVTLICLNINITKIFYLPNILLSIFFIIFSFIYGNSLFLHSKYQKDRMENVFSYMDNLIIDNYQSINVKIDGTIGFSNELKSIMKKYPMISKLLEGDNIFPYEKYSFLYYYYSGRLEIKFVDSFYRTIEKDKEAAEEKNDINENVEKNDINENVEKNDINENVEKNDINENVEKNLENTDGKLTEEINLEEFETVIETNKFDIKALDNNYIIIFKH